MKSSQRIRSRLHRDQKGAAAVEFAIVATLFFMLVFGIIDFGFAFHSWNNAVNSAREGARYGAVHADEQGIKDRVTAAAQTLDQSKLTISVLCSKDAGNNFGTCVSPWEADDIVRVVVDYEYDMITPVGSFVPGLGPTLTLHSQSEARYEG